MRPSDDTIAKAIGFGFVLFVAAIAAGGYVFQPDPVPAVPASAVTVTEMPAATPSDPPLAVSSLSPEDEQAALAQLREEAASSLAASLPTDRPSFPVHIVTVCRDGWLSHSTGQGTCSHHGGEAP